ncbi:MULTISPECIES: outer membrane protein [unclassified Polynucleobacter]|uniref:outer membrane protein n=1 Tax=unclassified Polynucleobacter TaxID=2640945 RepID=UPI001C0DB42A|nr:MULTISPECIES: outer membrane beta-barrel protein [unclassified Polynucleobacter]MBU3617980.1 outer membrane beta-barrel protein [Polynucleobacter sp. JS-Fieb-80-E5]MEA9601501.1 outer membrane beta-barrel protein [Polynucleobacter sp. MG-28-Ekke-A2]
MQKKLLVAALFSISATATMAQNNAQTNPFEGPSIGVSVSSVGGSTDLSGTRSANMGQQSVVPTIDAGYAFGLTKEVALGLTGTYDLADTKGGSDGSANLVGKKHYSINFKPGYVLGTSNMIYALLGYNRMSGTLNNNGYTGTSNLNGIGYGIGIETLLDKNIYLKVEGQQVKYSSSTVSGVTFKPSTTIATIGLGYKF